MSYFPSTSNSSKVWSHTQSVVFAEAGPGSSRPLQYDAQENQVSRSLAESMEHTNIVVACLCGVLQAVIQLRKLASPKFDRF